MKKLQLGGHDAGLWMIEPVWFEKAMGQLESASVSVEIDNIHFEDTRPLFKSTEGGVALISIEGAITKGFSFFGGTDSVRAARAVKAAAADESVKSILLHIDSPGGHVAGTQELADAVAIAAKTKNVVAHIDDLGASAAFWIASQARSITANRTAEVGSIGTVATAVDLSKAAEAEGIKVHVISTGKFKGAFTPGTEITDAMLADLQQRVDDLNAHFLKAVAKGRKMNMEAVEKVADGRVHIAAKAKKLGLIDAIGSLDEAVAALSAGKPSSNRRRRAAAIIKLSEAK